MFCTSLFALPPTGVCFLLLFFWLFLPNFKVLTMAKMKCSNVDCLVAAPADALLAAWEATHASSRPLVDGVELTAAPSQLAAQGAIAPGVPVIAGSLLHDDVCTSELPPRPQPTMKNKHTHKNSFSFYTLSFSFLQCLYPPAIAPRPSSSLGPIKYPCSGARQKLLRRSCRCTPT